jgi:hypothetical protein
MITLCTGGLVCTLRFSLVNSLLRAAAAPYARTVVTLPFFTRRGAEFSPPPPRLRAGPGRELMTRHVVEHVAAMFTDDQFPRMIRACRFASRGEIPSLWHSMCRVSYRAAQCSFANRVCAPTAGASTFCFSERSTGPAAVDRLRVNVPQS